MKVEVYFTKTPVGRFGLAYFQGDVAAIEQVLAEQMELEGYCRINRVPPQTKQEVVKAAGTQKVETAALKGGNKR